jgi:methylenetetrahydrofolate dehydrogenase (NADP+)/methenyltetrahydrofolate cyclohydrolase
MNIPNNILDGREFSKKLYNTLTPRVKSLVLRGITPSLKIILIGAKPDSVVYTDMKRKRCEKLGIECDIIKLPSFIDAEAVCDIINDYNKNRSVHGIMVQLPLPIEMAEDTRKIVDTIHQGKDVDGLTSANLGKIVAETIEINDLWNVPFFISSTIYGILHFISSRDIDLVGKNVAVIGNSSLIGLPASIILSKLGATVEISQIYTNNLSGRLSDRDIIIVGCGKRELIRGESIKQGAIIIDIGINVDINTETGERKIYGDCNFEECRQKASLITPVPGGVGPMTIYSLIEQLVKSAEASDYE